MKSFWEMLTTTLGSAAVISAIAAMFFSSKKFSGLQTKNKYLYKVLLALIFGALSIYASASAIKVDGALCNCRNLAPLFAGIVGGPIAGIGSALIGGLFRFFVYGGESAMPCMLACFLAGIIGSLIYIIVKEPRRYSFVTGLIASVLTEGCHMLILWAFNQGALAQKIALPIVIANICGLAFSLFIYRRFNKVPEAE